MSLGGGYSQSQQSSESGGPLSSVTGTSRGQAQNQFMNLLFGRGPGRFSGEGFGEGGVLGQLRERTMTPAAYTPPNIVGGIRNAFQEAVTQGLGKYSADYGRRGFNRPENLEAIVGSTVQNVAPQFAPYYAQQAQAEAEAPLIREDLMRKRFADLLAALGINVQALGQEGKASGSSFGMNVYGSGTGSGGGGGGASGGTG